MAEVTLPVPVPVTVQRFECPFCKRRRSARKAAAEHIGRCWLNPAARACKTCAHFTDEPDGGWCLPGRPCECNRGYRQCEAGVADVTDGTIMSGCPLWQLRKDDDG